MISCVYSDGDDVLRQAYGWGEAYSHGLPLNKTVPAMGLEGCQDCEALHSCESVNASASVRGHNPNLWLLSPQVMACIADVGSLPPSGAHTLDGGRKWFDDEDSDGGDSADDNSSDDEGAKD